MEEFRKKTNLEIPKLIDGGIRLYDGYRGAPIWVSKENDSTYYDNELDSQCVVPAVQSLKELKEELGILDSQNVYIHEFDDVKEEFEKQINESSDNPTLKKVHKPTLK